MCNITDQMYHVTGNFRFIFPDKKGLKNLDVWKILSMQSQLCQNKEGDFDTFHMNWSHVQIYH